MYITLSAISSREFIAFEEVPFTGVLQCGTDYSAESTSVMQIVSCSRTQCIDTADDRIRISGIERMTICLATHNSIYV